MKLKTIFYILMTVVFLVLTAVIWIYSQHLMAQINEMWGARFAEKQVLFDKQRTLQALMREITLSRQMAAEPALVEMALHEDDPAILQYGLKVLEHYRPNFQDRSVFAAMVKTGHYYFNDAENKHGKPKLRYTLSPNHPDDHWFYRFVDSRLDYEINVNPDSHLGNTKVWINVAIKHNNEVIGLLGSGLDISEFIKESLAVEQPGISNVFIGRDLTIQIYRDDKLTDYANIPTKVEQRNKVDVLLTDPADVEHLREVMRQLEKTPKQTAAFWVTHKDEKHLMGVAYLPEIGWFNLSFMDYQSSTLLHDFSIAPILSMILLMSLLAVGWMLHRLVLEPVARLKIGMDKVAFGGVNERIDETGKGELPTLARNFNEMTAKLSETTVSRNLLTAEVAERKRIEDELRQQRDINQHYLDTAQTLMVALDGEGKITMINRAAQELLGYTEYELLGRNWFETCLPQPDGMEIVYPVFLRLMTSGITTTNTFENTVLCRDGSQPLIAWHNSCLLDNKGRIIGTLSSGMDITEHKLAEAQKSKSLSLQKATLESTHDAILVVDLDNNWVLHNQRFIDMWHITDEIIAAQDDSVALSYVLDQLECPSLFQYEMSLKADRISNEK